MEVKPGYKQTEVGVIPEDWKVRTIGEMFRLVNGCAFKPEDWKQSGTPIIRIQNLNDPYASFNYFQAPVAERNRVEAGDLLFAWSGTIGTSFGARVWSGPSGVLNQHIFKVHMNQQQISLPFSMLVFGRIEEDIAKQAHGFKASFVHVKKSDLVKVSLPLPPLPEQRAIAEALSDVDGLLGGLDRLIAKKRDLKQAAMQQLLTGQTRLPGFTGEWEVKTLGDCLLSWPDYGINAAAVPFSDRFPSYIRITDISEHGRYCPAPRVSVNASSADQYYLHKGDVTFARTGASVGKSYLYEPSDGELVFAGFLIRVRPNPELLISTYLAAYATTAPYWNWVRLMSMRSGQPGINGAEYTQLPLSVPPLPEQTAIAEVLTEMDTELAGLEQQREKTHILKQAMMQELLTGRTRLV
jgi:type I restriction enzyme S subunit